MSKDIFILGISALYHDSAAALIKNGEIVAAAQEERFTRKKHDSSMPLNAVEYCLRAGSIPAERLDCVVFYDNPILSLERFLSNLGYAAEDSRDLFDLICEDLFGRKLWINKLIQKELNIPTEVKIMVTQHHISHGASAFFPSPYDEAAVLTLDGVGEWATTTIGYGKGNKLRIKKQIRYPHSIGLLYSAFTYFCGFKVNSGDYKLMGLAPYGRPVYTDLIKEKIIHIKPDGSFRLNMDYFDYQYGRAMTNEKFAELFGGPRRMPEAEITRREMDIAASVQKVLEEIVILLAHTAKMITGAKNLVMAGGVALNCVANGKLLREKIFDNIWIQPAAGDAGGALGSALYVYYDFLDMPRTVDDSNDAQKGTYLGPEYSDEQVKFFLEMNHYSYLSFSDENSFYKYVAEAIDSKKVIGLFKGRMEFGPRSLGNRSIIGDAYSETMQSQINLKIKYRESFRPFAPSVLADDCKDYFELNQSSPYMLLCADVNDEIRLPFDMEKMFAAVGTDMLPIVNTPRSAIPAVTHVDYSARIQTVSEKTNKEYYKIIQKLKEQTGKSVIINTSFNVRGEPIVCSLEDAYLCFMRTEMDILVLNRYVLLKEKQKALEENCDWRTIYELD